MGIGMKRSSVLDEIRAKQRERVCRNCQFFTNTGNVLGCEYSGKLILKDYVPYSNANNPCKNFKGRTEF